MAYQFLVYVPREGVPTLTEGGALASAYADAKAAIADMDKGA